MKKRYYYFISSLPELNIQDKSLDHNDEEFHELLLDVLDKDDLHLIKALYYPNDIRNLAHHIKHMETPHDKRGNISSEELKTGLIAPETLPVFMEEYINDNRRTWETTSFHAVYNSLTTHFIDWTHELPNNFLRRWYNFENDLRNILAGLNSRKYNREIQSEVLGEHFEAVKMRRNKDRDFGLSKVINDIGRIITSYHENNMVLRESHLDQLRWDFIESLEVDYKFSIENIMAYVLKIRLIERDILSSEVSGDERINYLLQQMKKGHELEEQTT